jgi:two-component system LytT family response regulator
MKPIRCIIIDDEELSMDALIWELEGLDYPFKILCRANSGQEGLNAIQVHQPELVFLDIEMPGMSGIEMMQRIPKINFKVIFVTAYDQYAIDAFKVHAVDYLLKPVMQEDLKKAIDHFLEYKEQIEVADRLEALFETFRLQDPRFSRVALPTMEGLEFVDVANILRCESDSNYCRIFLVDGSQLYLSKTLKEMESILSGHPFVRTHNSHLVNLSHVQRYIKGKGGYLILKDNSNVPVSRNRKEYLLEQL